MKIEALHDKVLVKVHSKDTVSKGGIILPEQAAEEKSEGTIVDIGPLVKQPLAIGDVVMYPKFGGDKIVFEDQEYKILKEIELFCRVVKDA